MPDTPSPAQQAASSTNGARSHGPATAAGKVRAARNGTRHGLRGGAFAPLPGEDTGELEQLRQAVASDWSPRDAFERHWAAELVAALWRQQRLRRLEFAALEAAAQEQPPTEASLKRLLTFARYGARIDKELAQALRALRALKARAAPSSAEPPVCTPEPEPAASSPARTFKPEPPALHVTSPPAAAATAPLNRHERRRLEALARQAERRAA